MSPSFRQPRTLPHALLLFAVLAFTVLAALAPMPVSAEGAPYKEVPGYPKYGCYDVVTGGNGMWSGATPYPISVSVPGPVVDAFLVWIGTEDAGAPNSPNQSDLSVNGTTVIGNLVDSYKPGVGDPWWYMWRADVGPSGANLVNQGANSYSISGWNFVPDGSTRRHGISLVVVYSTGACASPNQVDLIDNFDYYWERQTGTTDVLAFTFPPMPVDRDVTVWLHHAGTDHIGSQDGAAAAVPAAVLPSACRGMNLWARTGTGTPPPTLVNYSTTPPSPANGGRLVVTDPFVGANCESTTWTFPVTSLTGWVDGQGWRRDVGGYIAPQWSIVKITVRVRANETYLALQLESEKTGAEAIEETGESGAWFAQAVIPIQEVKLRISKTDGVDTAKPGDTLTYTLNYANYGGPATADTTIVDELPAGVTFVSASNGGVYDAATRTVRWNVGTVAGGASGQVTVTVTLDPVFPAGTTTLTNRATISTSTPVEIDLSDNTATDTTNVVAQAQLAITKVGAPEPVDAGGNLTYTINWTVGGDAYSENVTIVDTLPSNVTFVSASNGGTAAGGTVTWNLGNVTPTMSGTVTLVVKVNSPQPGGTEINNSVTIRNQAGDSATATARNTVRTDVGHLLTITKTNNLGGQPVDVGAELIWTIGYSVSGAGGAPNAVITDQLPAQVDFVSASNGGTYNAATRVVTWPLGNLSAGASGSVILTVRVHTSLDNNSTISNTAVITDDDGARDEATDTVTVRALPILNVTKTNNPTGTVRPGDTITYQVCFSNTGVGNATNVVLTDPIPVNTTYVPGSATGGATYSEPTRTLSWSKASLAPGEEVCGTFQVRVNLVITGLTGQANVAMSFAEWNAVSIDNTATVTATGLAPKSATVSNALDATVKPVIYKSADKTEIHQGDPVEFTVTLRNEGSAAATNVVVTDQVPPRLEAVTVTATKGTVAYDPVTRLITLSVGMLNPGETVVMTIKGKAAFVAPQDLPYLLNNEAVVAFTEGAPRTSNRVTVTVVYFFPDEIPEPGTWLMLGTGLAGLAGYARMRVQARRRKQQ